MDEDAMAELDSYGEFSLTSVSDTKALLSPIESAPRIKYTCVATSQHYIALGANTGGVYCFHQHGYRYIRILANQEGGVALLRFSPAENALAVCCGRGHVSLWELNLREQGISKRVHVSTLLKDAMVTDMVWGNKSDRLFFGDDQGRLAVSYMPKKVFKKPDELLCQEKPIVQMDAYQELLLVSTVTRCVIFNVTSREVLQIGKRSREGPFGACFNVRWPGKPPVVYSARPGGRLWEADVKGTVVSTLRLKELIKSSSTPLLGYQMDATLSTATPALPLHFSTLSILSGRYLVCSGPGCLYFFHTASYQLAGWTECVGMQDQVYCDGRSLWLLREGGRALQVLQFLSVSTSVQQLVCLNLLNQAQQVLEQKCGEVELLLSSDNALLKACRAVIAEAKIPLSQQLLSLQQKVDSLGGEVGVAESNGVGVAEGDEMGVAESNGVAVAEGDEVGVAEGDEMGVAESNGVDEVGVAEMEEVGVAEREEVKLYVDVAGVEIGLVDETDGKVVEVGVTKGSGVDVVGVTKGSGVDVVGVTKGSGVDVVGVTKGSGVDVVTGDVLVDTEPTYVGGARVEGAEPSMQVLSGAAFQQSMAQQVQSNELPLVQGPSELSQVGGPSELLQVGIPTQVVNGSPQIPVNADFPCGPPFHSALEGEPDLDATLLQADEEELASSNCSYTLMASDMNSGPALPSADPTLDNVAVSGSLPRGLDVKSGMGENAGVGVARSHSKVIPLPPNHCPPFNGTRTPDSTPSSSVGGSVGQLSLSREGRRTSWQSEGPGKADDDDVIAVPMIVRSTSTGSLGGTRKGKKKSSKRKKTASPQPLPQQLQTPTDSNDSSLPAKSSASPSSLLHIPEEDLPFPEAGLPSSMQSSPATSLTNSPFPSLPSTPPLSRNTSTPPQAAPSTRGHNTDRADSHSELLQRVTERVQEPVLERPKPSRSSSIDFGSALSKVKSMALHGGQSMGQKVVKGFLSSLSTPSHDQGSSGQPVLYRNSDVQYPPSATPTAGVISPSSSVERGEFASMASPLSDHSDLNDWVTPPPSSPPPQAYTPHQDTLAFTNTSMETRSDLETPAVLCSPDKMRSILCGWLKSLEDYMKQLISATAEQQLPSLVAPPPPFTPLPYNVLATVTYLATLCAELAIYSSAESANEPEEPCGCLEAFIGRYTEVLDLSRIRCLLARQTWAVRVKGWWALNKVRGLSLNMDRSHPGALSDQEMLSSIQSPCAPEDFLTLTVSTFPRLMPWEVALTCNVHPDKSHDFAKGSHDQRLYVTYLNRLFSNHGSQNLQGIITEVFETDHTLLSLSLAVVLKETEKPQNHTHTGDGLPRHGSHRLQWEELGCLERLVAMGVSIVAMGDMDNAKTMLTTCQDAGYWLGAIRLLVAMGDRKEAIKTILSLDDMNLLTQPQPWGCVLGSVEDWQMVVDSCMGASANQDDSGPSVQTTPASHQTTPTSMETTPTDHARSITGATQAVSTTVQSDGGDGTPQAGSLQGVSSSAPEEDGVCLNHHQDEDPPNMTVATERKEITDGGVLKLLVTRLPPASVGKLANSRHLLMREDVQALIVATTSLHTQQRAVGHSLLERVDRYLWSPRPSQLGPHLYTTFNTEKEAESIVKDSALPPGQPLPPSMLPFALTLEEGGAHWGVRTAGSTCSLCRLALASRVSERSPGVISFICGHTFHKSCVPELACVQCFKENLQNTIGSFSPTQSPSHFLSLQH